ncbi:MAG: thioredoxin family protein [Verrucomicrobia bacterium]|nr:thioredoxin family protein [Verrucomicrobiota bacterium]
MLRRFAFLLLIVSSILFTTALQAQVTASLVAPETSIQPGRPITVALRLVHEPHWHTYWINAGTGYPTSLTWQLPEGWTASEIQWPAPITIKDATGTITGNGYEGEILLPVTITPPATLKSGESIALRAKAEWLMCKETCIPGQAEVALTLPVSNETPTTDKSVRDTLARLPLPKPPVGWKITATQSTKTITLTLAGSNAPLANPRFFSTDALIQYDESQPVTTTAGSIRLVLPVSPSFEGKPTKLLGVLSYGESAEQRRGLSIDASLTAAPAPTNAPATTSLLPTLLLAFVGGLILNLMPCVFPVLGIKILGFVNQAGSDRRKVTLHGIVFALGVLASFWTLAAVLAVLRAGGSQLGWGFQLQSPAFVFVLAAVMLVFGLNMSGVFEFGLRATAVGSELQSKSGYTGSFFTGILATVVATPCSAPFLAPALGAALALSTAASFAIFTTIAIGLSAPYLLLSIFPGAIKILPRPGAWMETFKQFMAFPLYGTVGYLVWVLAGQLTDTGLLNTLLGLTVIAMAIWLYGRNTAPGSKPARVRFAFIGGAILLGSGALLGWPRAAAPTDIVWEKWSPAAVASAQAEGKTIYVDFTARWCATCQANKRLVFGSDEVKRLFRERRIVTLKGDWTNHDPAITAELAKYGRSAVPFNLIYKPGTTEPIALPELLTPSIVLEALR